MTAPDAWDFALLALFAFRATRLVGWDDLTAGLRARITLPDAEYDQWIEVQHTAEQQGQTILQYLADERTEILAPLTPPEGARWWAARLIRCPWCIGFWISIVVSLAYYAAPDGTVIVSIPFALSALVGLGAKWLDP